MEVRREPADSVRSAGLAQSRERSVAVVGNIGIDTNVYLPEGFAPSTLEATYTDNVDVVGQAGGMSAFGFSRLGVATRLVGSLGDDVHGRWIRRELARAKIDSLLFEDPGGTARSVNLVSRDGSRKNFYDGKGHMTLSVDLVRCREFLRGAYHAHFNLANWTRHLLPLARDLGLSISTDLQDVVRIDDPYRSDFIEASDLLFCSAVNRPAEELGSRLVERNPNAIVVIGMGSRGAALSTRAGFRHYPPFDMAAPVVDTNGAGDSLAVGFIVSHVFEGSPADEAIRCGQIAARFACTMRSKWQALIDPETLRSFREGRG